MTFTDENRTVQGWKGKRFLGSIA